MNPNQASLITQGDNAFNYQHYPEALSFYTQALQLDTSNQQILTKIGNTYFSMQMYDASQYFYQEALANTGAYTIIYEYALNPIQPPDVCNLQENLRVKYNIDIIPEGLELIISNIQLENQEKPTTPYMDIKHAQPWEHLAISLFRQAGIPFFGEIFDLVHQFKHLTPTANINQKSNVLSKRMSWQQFEDLLQKFFEQKGFLVQKTKKSYDQGADLLIESNFERVVVQIKHQKKVTGNRAIQEVHAARGYYNANRAIVITSSRFSRHAIKLASALNVEIWDWEQLLKQIQK